MIQEEVGRKIKLLRTEKNISQEKLSLIAGLDRTYIASVESGKRNISIKNLEKIILALDTTLAVFFSNFGENNGI